MQNEPKRASPTSTNWKGCVNSVDCTKHGSPVTIAISKSAGGATSSAQDTVPVASTNWIIKEAFLICKECNGKGCDECKNGHFHIVVKGTY